MSHSTRCDPASVLARSALRRSCGSVSRARPLARRRRDARLRESGDGQPLASVRLADAADVEAVIAAAVAAGRAWRDVPAPKRGDAVRTSARCCANTRTTLGTLVALEIGKIKAEGDGEVQEMIDIADFAVGLSRQLYGRTIASERPQHRMFEQWHPLGRRRRDHRVQLPRRGVGVERDARRGVRQRDDLEAVAEDPADGASRSRISRTA